MVERFSENETVEVAAQKFAASIEMGLLAPEAVSLAGLAALNKADINSQQTEEKKKQSHELITRLIQIQEYRQRLDEMIRDLERDIAAWKIKRDKALIESQEAFEKGDAADDLLKAIEDGISEEERQQIIDLIGEDASLLSQEELIERLEEIRDKENVKGRAKFDEVEELEKLIKAGKEEHAFLKEAEKNLLSSNEAKKQSAMQTLDELSNIENQLQSDNEINFSMPGLN